MASGDIQFIEDFNGWQTLEPTPFFPQVKPYLVPHTADNAGSWGNLDGVGITFNQAYVINTTTTGGALTVGASKILNMEDEWVIKNSHEEEDKQNEFDEKTVNFVVEIIRDSDSLDIIKATFMGITGSADELINKSWKQTPVYSSSSPSTQMKGGYPRPVTAELDDEDLWLETTLNPLWDNVAIYQEPYTGYIPVCEIFRGELQGFSLRDNIHLGERQIKQMAPRSKKYADESANGWHLVDSTGFRTNDELMGITENPQSEWTDKSWGGTGSAGVMSLGNFDPDSLYFKDVAPMMFRSIVGGSGVSISPYENTIVIDTYGGGNAIPWSGKCCGTNIIDTYCVYKDHNGQDGTHDNPAVFRKITGANGITVNFGDSEDANDADGDDCLIVISGADGGMPWSGQNCGRDGGANNHDAPWALTQGVNAGHSRAKNVYKAYTANQDGTHTSPAIFRRLSGDKRGDSKTVAFENGGVIVDYDERENCLIGISGHIWSGDNCGTTSDGIGIYKEQEGLQDGIHQNPAIFRRLLGDNLLADKDGVSLIELDQYDDCTVLIPARWSGENTDCGDGAASVFIDQHETAPLTPETVGSAQTPAQFRQLIGANNLADGATSEMQINVLKEDDDCVRIRGNGVNGSLTIASGIWVDMYDPAGHPVLGTTNTITLTWKDGLITTEGEFTQVYTQPPE